MEQVQHTATYVGTCKQNAILRITIITTYVPRILQTTTRRLYISIPLPPLRSKSPIQNKPNEVQRRLLEVETEYPHPISWKRAVPCRRSPSEVDWTSSRVVRASGPRPRKCKSVNAETLLQASFRLIRWSPQGKSPGQPMFRRGLEGDHSGDAGRLTRCANWTNGWEMMSGVDSPYVQD